MCIRDRLWRYLEFERRQKNKILAENFVNKVKVMGDDPVSYTHLDVYKRQPHIGSREGARSLQQTSARKTSPATFLR